MKKVLTLVFAVMALGVVLTGCAKAEEPAAGGEAAGGAAPAAGGEAGGGETK